MLYNKYALDREESGRGKAIYFPSLPLALTSSKPNASCEQYEPSDLDMRAGLFLA